ncbi:hypothetical protein EDEG_03252 [Edhazardia aedis USNM 41457]|uniref:GIT Spa2 homology (SHD) domain-containing protein n=1 Tax=Edhazardia aedis (strain USNM 41457) TaxID=1003232 RepID=J9D397_EDHAE|nr:hypothetical protein EDEG_03252 [Edhazardia aedis USNM 41457]|eukprot:EJW02311.1 hypothetical protein EDEG_03252 [Edhazardia aedis USNM 41457]
MMDEERERIRKRIEDYVGETLTAFNFDDRQKEAIRKMTFLKQNEFEELLEDLSNEIDRRLNDPKSIPPANEAISSKRNLSIRRLARLAENKFKNLLTDVILVYNHRFPSPTTKNTEEIENLICDLSTFVMSLKNDSEYETLIIKRISSEKNVRTKVHIYNKYIRRIFEKNKEDLSVVDFMEDTFKNIFSNNGITIDKILDPITFLNLCNRFFEKKTHLQLEYEYHSGNIRTLLDEDIFDTTTRNTLIAKETAAIMSLMYNASSSTTRDTQKSIEIEINSIISNLEAIKIAMQKENSHEEFYIIARSVLEVCENLLNKLNVYDAVDVDMIEKLVTEKSNLQNCVDKNLHENIPCVIFNMANLVKSILYSIPSIDFQ